MSNFSVGTIVMLRCHLPLTLEKHGIVNGAVGEVVEGGQWVLDACNVVVYFPQYPSHTRAKTWQSPVSWLIPLSDPDIDVTENEKQPVRETI